MKPVPIARNDLELVVVLHGRVGEGVGEPANDREHRQRDDERVDPESKRETRVDESDDDTGRDGYCQPDRQIRRGIQRLHRHHADEGLHRPHREIDLATDDQQRHPDRRDHRHRHLTEQDEDVPFGGKDGRKPREHDAEDHQDSRRTPSWVRNSQLTMPANGRPGCRSDSRSDGVPTPIVGRLSAPISSLSSSLLCMPARPQSHNTNGSHCLRGDMKMPGRGSTLPRPAQ